HFGMQIAQFLPYRPAVIEQMLNVITHHIFTAIVFVVVIFTFKSADASLADMNDPSLITARRAITDDIASLSSVAQIDYDGIIL
ncbi:uroporphyrinogen-III C-methyltransferase, partial [Salmonella enterica subsp. enterica serovar Kentucky]|nr:uroporphyrinogen-III C-methyltransferase [Salmonella enterica subsp. enterica serovar Kentucky]